MIKRPTAEECDNHQVVFDDGQQIGYAIWYPQMGGYVGTAVAIFDREWTLYPHRNAAEGGCIDVLIWHDGEFPFGDNQTPVEIHHCDPEQFIEFGKFLAEINEKGKRIEN